MVRRISIILALTVVAMAADALAESLPDGAVRVKKADIVDPGGFEQPMTAATILVPFDWQTQGGVIWQQAMSECGPKSPHVSWVATSPDGKRQFQLLPDEQWNGSSILPPGVSQSGCPNLATTDMQEFVGFYVQRYRPGANFVNYRERTDIIEEASRYLPPQQPMYGMETRQWVGAGEATIAYDADGVAFRELVGVIAVFTYTAMGDGMGGITEMINIATVPGYAYRTPASEFVAGHAERIRRTYKIHPAWQAKMNQHNATMAGIAARGAADRSRIIAQHGEEMRQMQQDSWRRQNEASDRNSREFSEYIRDVETYDDPYHGGTVELDNSYEHAWQLGDGSYVLTNDPSFEPGKDLGVDGSRLGKAQ